MLAAPVAGGFTFISCVVSGRLHIKCKHVCLHVTQHTQENPQQSQDIIIILEQWNWGIIHTASQGNVYKAYSNPQEVVLSLQHLETKICHGRQGQLDICFPVNPYMDNINSPLL